MRLCEKNSKPLGSRTITLVGLLDVIAALHPASGPKEPKPDHDVHDETNLGAARRCLRPVIG